MKKKSKILGIDASRSANGSPTGVERYSSEIIKALLKGFKDMEIRLYTPKLIEEFPQSKQRIIPFPRLWTLFRLSLEMLFHKPDVLFVPSHGFPFFQPKKSYITVHDIAFMKFPGVYRLSQRWHLRWVTWRAVRLAAGVFVPSHMVKEDLQRFFHADPKKIHVVPHGPLHLQKVDQETLLERLHFFQIKKGEPLFFFIGRLEKKKNLLVLMDAWIEVQKKSPKGRLFLGGMMGHGFDELFHKMEDENMSGIILAPGFISETDVAVLFQAGTAMVLPSREEGFGLPILQAFESNSAVICSDISPHKEIAGKAALYANPVDPSTFAKHILDLMEHPEKKKKLVELGKQRLREFSWEKSAKKVANVLQSEQ